MSVLEWKKQFSEIPELKFWRAKGRSLEEQDNSRGVNVKNVFFCILWAEKAVSERSGGQMEKWKTNSTFGKKILICKIRLCMIYNAKKFTGLDNNVHHEKTR